jgi:hypothetical protein
MSDPGSVIYSGSISKAITPLLREHPGARPELHSALQPARGCPRLLLPPT